MRPRNPGPAIWAEEEAALKVPVGLDSDRKAEPMRALRRHNMFGIELESKLSSGLALVPSAH